MPGVHSGGLNQCTPRKRSGRCTALRQPGDRERGGVGGDDRRPPARPATRAPRISAFRSGSSGTASITRSAPSTAASMSAAACTVSVAATSSSSPASTWPRVRSSSASRARSASSADASASRTCSTGTREVAGDAGRPSSLRRARQPTPCAGRTPLICGSSVAVASGRVRSPARHARVRRRDGARAGRRGPVSLPAARRRARRRASTATSRRAPACSAIAATTPSRRSSTRAPARWSRRPTRRGTSRC